MINKMTRAVTVLAALTMAVLWGLVVPAAAETSEAADDATVSAPDRVAVGQGITIRGTGWVAPAGGGSVIAVKLDDGAIKRTTPIVDPASQAARAADIFAVVQVGADGSFTATVEFPTTANATETWPAGSKGSLRLLTGKLLEGDRVRSVEVSFKVVSGAEPAPSPTRPTVAPSPTTPATNAPEASKAPEAEKSAEIRMLPQVETTAPKVTAAASCSDQTTLKLTGESTSGGKPAAPLGGNLRLVGTGYCVENGSSGSTIAIKIDDGKYSRLDSKVNANRTVWQVIKVGSNGSFDVAVKLPTANQTTPAFTAGSHWLRVLTGSLKDGDKIRTTREGLDFVATGGGSSSSPSATSSASSTSTSSTSSSTTSTNSTSGTLASTGGSRPAILVLGLILVLAGIAVLHRDIAREDLGRNDS